VTADFRCDIAIVGGGLAGGLIAHALRVRRPELAVLLVEPGATLGGNHVWSFFASDIAAGDRWIVDPFVSHRWPDYDIAFPGHRRRLDEAYYSIRSTQFDAVLRAALPPDTIIAAQAIDVTPDGVTLADGRRIAGAVIDSRGPGDLGLIDCGWQKFVGQELRMVAPHGVARPVVMDATVEQDDGYRFVYLLPFGPDRLFVEDTYYADGPEIDRDRLAARIAAYASASGWTIAEVLHEEQGALPVAIGGDFDAYWRSTGPGVAKAGLRAGLFHPTTGYSLPDAVRTAALVATLADLSPASLHRTLHDHARRCWRARGFYRLLDTMLFRAAQGPERRAVLERFYRLDAGLIGRFYAARSTPFDKLRIVTGKPPVPVGRAIAAIRAR